MSIISESDEGTKTPEPDAGTKPPETGDAGELGEPGKAALEAERRARKEAERRLKVAEAEVEKAKVAGLSESERAVEEARHTAREETAAGFKTKLAASALRAAAAAKLQDPEDALRFLDLAAIKVDDEGEVDTKGLAGMVDGLLKEKPYLAANPPAARPGPLPGGGPHSKGGDSEDMNGFIRRLVSERRG